LVAVWIDSEMRGFEREFAAEADAELFTEAAFDEPGNAGSIPFRPLRVSTGSAAHPS
jgi:hypothetical protein